MASWNRAHVLKAAFLLCILLLLLLNFSNFRSKLDTNNVLSKFSTRTSEAFVSGMPWSMRSHSQRREPNDVNDINSKQSNPHHTDDDDEQKSATNLIRNEQILLVKPLANATNILYSSEISNNSTKSIDPEDVVERIKSEQKAENLTNSKDSYLFPIVPSVMTGNKTDRNSTIRNVATPCHTNNGPFFLKLMTKLGMNACPMTPPNLNGPIEVDIEYETLPSVESKFRNKLLPGGWYKPRECNPKDRVAIVIPYRDRENHLPIFLKNLHPLLMKQQIEYGIFVVEQIADGLFNRAALMNVGFLEALKLHQWDCFIFHDVDLIPMDDRNLYTCPDQPRHMSVAVDTMGFKLPYSGIFGGVSAMTVRQFQTVNGFSNSFWGWGGEDDDMSNRLRHVGYHIARYPVNIARYTMLTHRKEKANPKRYEKLVNGVKKFNTEGLNLLKYEIRCFERKILYTWILVEIKQDSVSAS